MRRTDQIALLSFLAMWIIGLLFPLAHIWEPVTVFVVSILVNLGGLWFAYPVWYKSFKEPIPTRAVLFGIAVGIFGASASQTVFVYHIANYYLVSVVLGFIAGLSAVFRGYTLK